MTAAHLDHDALANLAEGILDEAAATSAEEHLAGCAGCRGRAAEVAEVSRVLAEAPMPPMPAHLMERLDAAIAAEAASRPPARRWQAHRLQILVAAAAAVVAVGGGAAIARSFLDGGSSTSSAISQPPVAEPSRPHQPNADVLPMHPYATVRSGTNYTETNLAAKVAALLSAKQRTLTAPTGTLDGCIRRVGAGRAPLLVDSATYDGAPATVIALPGAGAHQVDVWIVGPACSAADSDLIVRARIPR